LNWKRIGPLGEKTSFEDLPDPGKKKDRPKRRGKKRKDTRFEPVRRRGKVSDWSGPVKTRKKEGSVPFVAPEGGEGNDKHPKGKRKKKRANP